jgi:hypothetical protein
MAEPKDPKTPQKRPFKYRLRLKEGQYYQHNEDDEVVMYERGNVFMCQRPLHVRYSEKFELASEGTPLTTGARQLPEGYDPDFDEGGTVGSAGTTPTITLPKQPEEPKPEHKAGHVPPKK